LIEQRVQMNRARNENEWAKSDSELLEQKWFWFDQGGRKLFWSDTQIKSDRQIMILIWEWSAKVMGMIWEWSAKSDTQMSESDIDSRLIQEGMILIGKKLYWSAENDRQKWKWSAREWEWSAKKW
jgi:hypothetical protein